MTFKLYFNAGGSSHTVLRLTFPNVMSVCERLCSMLGYINTSFVIQHLLISLFSLNF